MMPENNEKHTDPPHDCHICPRLVQYRTQNQQKYPHYFNAPIPAFGDKNAELAIVGLAPGVKGANRTGRAFTGDYAGTLMYQTLLKFGFASGTFNENGDDDLALQNCRIINAVRCVPPQNKPETPEIINCNPFLAHALKGMKNLKIIIALGGIAHQAVLRRYGLKLSQHKFGHGLIHHIIKNSSLVLLDSYHCSRYNTQTKRLTEQQFYDIFAKATELLGKN